MTNLKLNQKFRRITASKYTNDAPIHRHIVMNPMHQEMQREERRPIGQQVINMEQEAMKGVLECRPDDVSCEEAHYSLSDGLGRNGK